MWFIWRIPSDLAKQDTHKAKVLMDGIEKNINVCHTREMRHHFASRYHLVAKVNKAVLIDMYQYLTGDQSTTSLSEGVQEKLQIILDSQGVLICGSKTPAALKSLKTSGGYY